MPSRGAGKKTRGRKTSARSGGRKTAGAGKSTGARSRSGSTRATSTASRAGSASGGRGRKMSGSSAGSRSGKAIVRAKGKQLTVRVAKAARLPVAVVLPVKGLSAKKSYVLRMRTIGASGPIAQVDVGFRVPAPRVAAGAAAG